MTGTGGCLRGGSQQSRMACRRGSGAAALTEFKSSHASFNSADVSDATLRWKFCENRGVVAGHDAIGRSSEFNHARLRGDIGLLERGIECGASAMRAQIFVEIHVVGGKDERRVAIDANVLRREGVMAAGESANAGKD